MIYRGELRALAEAALRRPPPESERAAAVLALLDERDNLVGALDDARSAELRAARLPYSARVTRERDALTWENAALLARNARLEAALLPLINTHGDLCEGGEGCEIVQTALDALDEATS